MQRLGQVFCMVFGDDDLVITEESNSGSIDEWDSLMHITLVIAVEKEFKLRLNPSEVGKLNNVGEMLDFLIAKTQSNGQN